jgi:hypothetical protein
MATAAGPAQRVVVVQAAGNIVQGGPAQPIKIVTDGRAVSGDPPIRVVVVTGRAVQAGPALPVVQVAASTPRVQGGPVLPVVLT